MHLLKQISSFILPITVLVIVPASIEKNWTVTNRFHCYSGSVLITIGLSMMASAIIAFIRIGKGTLAPWAPTKQFVATGLYQYMRNPMITGVLIVLLGESLACSSKNILGWAIAFVIINTIYFILYEEPNLEKRFGESYTNYKKHVSRWVPRLTPYKHSQTNTE